MPDFSIKRNDLLPPITATLTYSDGTPVDVTGATVRFFMSALTGGTAKVSGAATIVSGTDGEVQYAWAGTDTDTAGDYMAEWEVKFPSTKRLTFPNNGYLAIQILPDLGQG